ncbi:MAG: hypothetical protein GTO02_10260 [Candidatus Dadabacteria bacterium]|nr:hypothetical protein [Candidatus Dadabacteria bacterium]
MTKKFSQQELEDAYKQMEQERADENENVKKAAEWVKGELGFGLVVIRDPAHSLSRISPYPLGYTLTCIHETYGPYQNTYTDKLDSVDWATKNDSDWVYGYKPGTLFYDIKTPFGEFKLGFEYFDNHCTRF